MKTVFFYIISLKLIDLKNMDILKYIITVRKLDIKL